MPDAQAAEQEAACFGSWTPLWSLKGWALGPAVLTGGPQEVASQLLVHAGDLGPDPPSSASSVPLAAPVGALSVLLPVPMDQGDLWETSKTHGHVLHSVKVSL